MEILYLLIPISVVLVFLIGIAFWWSLKTGQFDDLEGPGYRILMDDDRPAAPGDGGNEEAAETSHGDKGNGSDTGRHIQTKAV
ncbi:MAG: cbb3-type cytochrome oxidase assembly protein CcoS [Sterolibacterium sp.]|nr:cbb3-type cytochrome oxidase assembly protein CcoS [Sterolibacterium sp.]